MAAMTESLKEMGPVKLGAMAAVGVAMLVFFGFIALQGSTSQMALLYSNLESADSVQITRFLDQNGVAYEIRENGSQIFVPAKEVSPLRMRMASNGIPAEGSEVGYEIFDRSESLGTSNFVHNVNLMRALEGELSRTISALQKVESARVHLVIPKRELFTRDKRQPTASVAVKLAGQRLDKGDIQSIRHLVATAVPGLEINKITIVDDHGKLLARGGDEDDIESLVSEADDYRVRYERRLQERLMTLIERTVGMGNVTVNVAADIDFDRIVKKSEVFDPESQVARSVQAIEENEESIERDAETNVSVRNNLPDPQAGAAGVVSETRISKTDETTNFEISKEVTNHVQDIGTVNKISVAVLVDGTYETAEDGSISYAERSPEELAEIERLVKSAIGFDSIRGDSVEVVNLPFEENMAALKEETPMDWLKRDFHSILQTGILGLVAILAILLVIRPLINRALETSNLEDDEDIEALLEASGAQQQLTDQSQQGQDDESARALGLLSEDEESLIDIAGVEGKVKSATYKRVASIVEMQPEDAVAVLRSWMTED